MRIYFFKRVHAKPSGGHKHIRHIVSALRAKGWEACIVLLGPAPETDFTFGVEVPIWAEPPRELGERLTAQDVVVFPEKDVQRYLSLAAGWSCLKGVLIQNGFYALECAPPHGYPAAGIGFAISVSPYIQALAHRVMGVGPRRLFSVPCRVANPPFGPLAGGRPAFPPVVAYMPRKLPEHARAIEAIVAPRFPHVRWIPIDGVAEDRVAQTLRGAGVFLSTQDREGLGLPALEAMACGCVVAGYAGTGLFPHPYANPQNGYWAKDRSVTAAARQLERALKAVLVSAPRAQEVRAAGYETARRYQGDLFAAGLQQLSEALREGGTRTAPVAVPGLGWGGRIEVAKAKGRRLLGSLRGRLQNGRCCELHRGRRC